jgi:hypothetical protein
LAEPQKLSVFTVSAFIQSAEQQLSEISNKTVNTDSSPYGGPAVWSSSAGSKGPDGDSPTPKGTSGLFNFSRLLRPQVLNEAYQILRMHANDATTGAVNICDEQERGRQEKRQDQEVKGSGFNAVRSVAN